MNDFKFVAQDIHHALQNNQQVQLVDSVRKNHQLLQSIGVVPEKITQFIAAIEKMGGAAKICGAGAVRGNQGGTVWVIGKEKKSVEKICEQWGFQLIVLKGEGSGVHLI